MSKLKKLLLTVILLTTFLIPISLYPNNCYAKTKYEKAKVIRIIDGDTIEVSISNRSYKIRLIGINTPESTIRHEPYGKEASNYTKSKLLGKTVYLEKDVSEADKYNRLLRYVWLSMPNSNSDSEIKNKMFNAILVLNGYAQVMTVPPDVKYSNKFLEYQRIAREKKKGLWGLGSSEVGNSKIGNSGIGNSNLGKIVYWTPNGKSYHYSKNCKTLRRSKVIIQGSLKEAIQNGKNDPCDICVK